MSRSSHARGNLAAAAALLCAFALSACRGEQPPTEHPPEPQAADTALRDAIQDPQQKARAVEDVLQAGDARQRALIDAAEGG